MKTLEEVEKIAVERYPICGHEDEYSDENVSQMNKQTAFLEGFLLSQEQDKWISVSERLPTENDNYITSVNGIPFSVMSKFHYGKWYWNNGTEDKECNDVTHWQPLPPKPKQ
jgi:hypothetical protein